MSGKKYKQRATKPLIDRIIEKTFISTGGCWIYTGSLNQHGYGNISRGRRCEGKIYIHVASYEYYRGPIPDNLQLVHKCRNRACCNPDHLEPVTSRVNILRGNSPGAIANRTGLCTRGHKLDETNTYPDGQRYCRECKAIADRKRYLNNQQK